MEGGSYRVDYEPAESSTGLFGGNSNWRGPIWMPVNALIVQSLRRLYSYYGDAFTVECPTGSGQRMTLWEVADETDPHWRDLILFYEYFHGDNGAGVGASHQTGCTGLAATLIQSRAVMDRKEVLSKGFDPASTRMSRGVVG